MKSVFQKQYSGTTIDPLTSLSRDDINSGIIYACKDGMKVTLKFRIAQDKKTTTQVKKKVKDNSNK